MPIKPENMGRYPGGSITSPQWRAIREEVLERAGHRCEQCGAPNGATVLRVKGPDFAHWIDPETGVVRDADTGEHRGTLAWSSFPMGRYCRIVLTIAHLDHDPTNNGVPGNRPNLKALCQREHLFHDREHHAEVRRATLQARRDAQRVREFGPALPGFL